MDYIYLLIGRQEYEERVRWLHSMYGNTTSRRQPSRVIRLLNSLLYVVGRILISLGERMQQPRQDMPVTAPVTK